MKAVAVENNFGSLADLSVMLMVLCEAYSFGSRSVAIWWSLSLRAGLGAPSKKSCASSGIRLATTVSRILRGVPATADEGVTPCSVIGGGGGGGTGGGGGVT